VGLGPNKVLSVPDAIGIALYDWYQEKQLGIQQELLRESRGPSLPSREEITVSHATPTGEQAQFAFDSGAQQSFIGTCPDCGSQLEYAEGCVKCHVCGFSECG
jgi:ribonucleoside-diphosphate reductase alpha chain